MRIALLLAAASMISAAPAGIVNFDKAETGSLRLPGRRHKRELARRNGRWCRTTRPPASRTS
jgi:hypothetical protein